MSDRLAHEILLLLSRLADEHDEQRVIDLFREAINGVGDDSILGEFCERPPQPSVELATPRVRFGGYPLRVDPDELSEGAVTTLTAAGEAVAVILEGLAGRRAARERERRLERHIEAATYELSAQAETYRLVLDSLRDAVYLWELSPRGELRCVEANEAALRMLGYEPEDIVGASPGFLTGDRDPARRSVGDCVKSLRRERRCEFQTVHETRDGRPVPVRVEAFLSDDSSGSYVISMARATGD